MSSLKQRGLADHARHRGSFLQDSDLRQQLDETDGAHWLLHELAVERQCGAMLDAQALARAATQRLGVLQPEMAAVRLDVEAMARLRGERGLARFDSDAVPVVIHREAAAVVQAQKLLVLL